jgi:hypothetical protein
MFFELKLKPIAPHQRHEDVEDILEARFREAECGEVTGGGTGSGCSMVDIELTDTAAGIRIIRNVLLEANLADGAELVQTEPVRKVITFHA